jgi:NAD+ kinase
MSDLRSPTATSIHPALTPTLPTHPLTKLPSNTSIRSPPPTLTSINEASSPDPNAAVQESSHSNGVIGTPSTGEALHQNTTSSSTTNNAAPNALLSPTVGVRPGTDSTSLPSSPAFAPKLAHNFHSHKKNALSVESIPRQTIMKALASAKRDHNPHNLSLASSLNGMVACAMENRRPSATSQKLSAALSDLAGRNGGSPSDPRFASMQSPCFYHERFDDAVNIDRVLEEIQQDGFMSHSRLMQTATGVREVSKQLQRRPIKRAVRNVMIVTKARDNQLVNLTKDLAVWLMSTPRYGSDLGVNVYVDAKLRNSKRFGAATLLDAQPRFEHLLKYWSPDLCWSQPEKFDLVLTLGGDGTVLFTSWLFQRIVPPILSFSLGSLGFLTNFEYDRFKEHLDKVMGDEGMRVNLRMRFTCTVYRDGRGEDLEEGEQFEVLNELVIDRGPSPYVSNLELFGDNELLTVVQADGCIFSTPTGSTAYSLSAGGSLVHPDIPAILLTPICPHTLSFRPMVLSDTMLLRVAIPKNSRATAYCSFDGKGRVELKQGDCVTIAASQYPFPTVTRTGTDWFNSVSHTLRWNTRAAMQKGWDGAEENKEEEVEWDIDTDSACYASEDSSISASPLRRQMSMLGL